MSIRSHAEAEMTLAGVESECKITILGALDLVLDAFDSGAAASVGFEMFTRLWAGKPLTPLTGADDEWYEPMPGGSLQNKRCSSVFKCVEDIPHRDLKAGDCYDIDVLGRDLLQITFPYMPGAYSIASPVLEFPTYDNPDGPTAA